MGMFDYINRLRHRRGYGIHSPWAYELLRDGLFEPLPYYCFNSLHGSKADRQLFRFVVWLRPSHYIACGGTPSTLAHLKAAWNATRQHGSYELFYFASDRAWEVLTARHNGRLGPHACVVIDGIDRAEVRAVWSALKYSSEATSSFEQTTRGIIFFDPARGRRNYLI